MASTLLLARRPETALASDIVSAHHGAGVCCVRYDEASGRMPSDVWSDAQSDSASEGPCCTSERQVFRCRGERKAKVAAVSLKYRDRLRQTMRQQKPKVRY